MFSPINKQLRNVPPSSPISLFLQLLLPTFGRDTFIVNVSLALLRNGRLRHIKQLELEDGWQANSDFAG